jgi:hypothetical protein
MDSPNRPFRVVPLHESVSRDDHVETPTSAADRLNMMWQLTLDAWAFKGEPVVEQRLPRHIVHIYRRGR